MKQDLFGFLARFEKRIADSAATASRGFSPMKSAREAVNFTTLVANLAQNQLASEIARLENAEPVADGASDEERGHSSAPLPPPPGARTHLGLAHQLRPIRMLTPEATKK
jgi:hypothetical protein